MRGLLTGEPFDEDYAQRLVDAVLRALCVDAALDPPASNLAGIGGEPESGRERLPADESTEARKTGENQ